MLASAPGTGGITVGADRGYDTRHGGYRLSQRTRRRIEEVFGWVKTVGGGRKLRYYGVARNRRWVELTIAGYNLVRLAKLTAVAA